MNKVIFNGNLTRDPDVRVVTVNGKKTSVVNFTVAVSRHFKKASGEKDKDVTFVSCEAWDTGAETIGKYLSKGSPILVEGSLKTESWEQEGQKRSRLKVRVLTFEILNRRPPQNETTKDKEPEPEKEKPKEDVPF